MIPQRKNNYHRRGVIKRGLTLLGGIFFLGAVRSSFGAATKLAEPLVKAKGTNRGPSVTQHCIEGVFLGVPAQDLQIGKS